MSKEYVWGVVAGIFFTILLIILLCRAFKIRRVKPKYDERQIAAQGQASKLAFFTLMLWCAACGMLDSFGIQWCDSIGTALYLGIFISVGVYAVTAVCKDAYFGYNESFKSARLLAIIGILNLVTGVTTMVSGEHRIIENGLLQSTPTMNLSIALLFAVILIVNRVHGKKAAEAEAAE